MIVQHVKGTIKNQGQGSSGITEGQCSTKTHTHQNLSVCVTILKVNKNNEKSCC